ncbi:MAG: phospho-sugar mutase [Microthrixaceae bacterium]
MSDRRILDAARNWRDRDPDPVTRSALDRLILDGDIAGLRVLFEHPLEFGTAGLRGPTGPGPARMNRLGCSLVATATAHVLRTSGADPQHRGVVIAHDARHGSEAFAAEVTDVFCAAGVPTSVIDGPAPTPLAAFAVAHLGAAAGIVVTASHNPAQDNGIKIYWSDGAQIGSPVDAAIATELDRLTSQVLGGSTGAPGPAGPRAEVTHLGRVAQRPGLVTAYMRQLAGLPGVGEATAAGTSPPDDRPLDDRPLVAHTALHGVGADLFAHALTELGVARVVTVESQRDPDPEFPTVEFPNPEEPGAMSAVLDLAEEIAADAALANDPDADRLAMAVRARDGRWRTLSGDELGALFAWFLLEATSGDGAPDDGAPRDVADADRLLASTVVSSRLVAAMAAEAGVHHVETLTGFKHLSRPAMAHPQWYQLMAYEEALGYAIGPAARDKDGIAAGVVACALIARLRADQRTAEDVLDHLARCHGAFVTDNGSHRIEGPDARRRLEDIVAGLEADPPGSLGGVPVTSRDRPGPGVLRLLLVDRTRVVLRPSGTEPKFKYYCEAVEAVHPGESPDAARRRGGQRLEPVVAELRELLR